MTSRTVLRAALIGVSAALLAVTVAPDGLATAVTPIVYGSTVTYNVAATPANYTLLAATPTTSGGAIGQRFTPSIPGRLNLIWIDTVDLPADVSTLQVSITDDLSNYPAPGAALATHTGTGFSGQQVAFDFTGDNVMLEPGKEYLVTLENLGSSTVSISVAQAGYAGYSYHAAGESWADSGGDYNLASSMEIDLVDADLPTISKSVTPKAPDGARGWYVTRPLVSFTCSDATSGVATCPIDTRLQSRNYALQPKVVKTTDVAGHEATLALRPKVDVGKPRLQVTGVTRGTVYSSPPTVGCRASDAVSHLFRPCTVRVVKVTATKRVANARVVDVAGNVTKRSVTFFVR